MKLASCSRLSAAFLVLAGLLANSCFAQTSIQAADRASNVADQQIPPAVAKKLEAMEARIEQLEAELKARPAVAPLSAKASAPIPSATAPAPSATALASTSATAPAQGELTASQTPVVEPGKEE